jgi:vacuolar-type H+-ATPase subunit E/Vma4
MGIDALREAVEEEARVRVAGLLDEARAQAQGLRDQAEAQSAARLRAALSDEEVGLRREAAARIADARSAAQKRVLEARDALLERVFELARDELPAVLEGSAARAWVVALAEQALGHMPSGPVRIECSRDVAEPLEQALAGRDDVRVELAPELPSGFRVHDQQGSLVVDGTLTKLLELHRPVLAIDVLQRLERGAEA